MSEASMHRARPTEKKVRAGVSATDSSSGCGAVSGTFEGTEARTDCFFAWLGPASRTACIGTCPINAGPGTGRGLFSSSRRRYCPRTSSGVYPALQSASNRLAKALYQNRTGGMHWQRSAQCSGNHRGEDGPECGYLFSSDHTMKGESEVLSLYGKGFPRLRWMRNSKRFYTNPILYIAYRRRGWGFLAGEELIRFDWRDTAVCGRKNVLRCLRVLLSVRG